MSEPAPAPAAGPYLIISFHGHNEHVRTCSRGCCGPETLGTVHPRLVIQRAASADAAVAHIARLDRELRDDPHRGTCGWTHVAIDVTLSTVVGLGIENAVAAETGAPPADNFVDAFDVIAEEPYSAAGYLPDSWRDQVTDAIAALDAKAAAAIADRNRRMREAAEQRQREREERARIEAAAAATAAAAAAEAHDRAEYARLMAKYGNGANP